MNNRTCPKCRLDIVYKTKKAAVRAAKCNKNCYACTIAEVNRKQRTYSLSKLLDESLESFYWLGLCLADGSFNSKGSFELSLQSQDYMHLVKFAEFIDCKLPTKKRESFRLSFRNKDSVSEIMSKYNLLDSKTYNPPNFRFYRKYRKELLCSLLIGLIDGDGSICYSKKAYQTTISLTCHSNWEDFYSKLLKSLNLKFNRFQRENILRLTICRKSELTKLRYFLSNNKVPIMERKWNKIWM